MEKKTFMLIVLLLCLLTRGNALETITLSEAGTLSEVLSRIEKSEITNLAIKGKINAADLKVLRNAEDKLAMLDTLDLSNVELVPSDEDYYTYRTMSDESMNPEYHRFFISTERRDTFFIQPSLSSWPPHYYDHYDYNLTAAFCGTRFKRIIMPRTINDIGERTFMDCGNLQEVVMSQAPIAIGKEAFRGCGSLTLIPDLSKAETIGNQAFYNCAQLGMIQQSKHLSLTSAVTISDEAFYGCKLITAVGFSEKLKSIGGYAFYDCTSLTDVELSPNIFRLSYYTFQNTPWMKANKEVVDGITYLGTVAIELDRNMTTFCPREGTLGIADMFRRPGAQITTIKLPSSLRYIGKLSLRDINLTSIQLPEGLESIGERAFEGWTALKEISFPSSLKEIGQEAFNGCGLENVTIPDNIEEVGYRAFYSNRALKKVYFGAQHATGTYIFNSCDNLEEVTIGNQVKVIPGWTFFICDKIEKVTFGSQLEEIGEHAFEDSKILKHVEFPTSLRFLGEESFEECPLENIVIGENVEELGKGCLASTISLEYNRSEIPEGFYISSKLETIKFGDKIKTIPSKAFDGCGYLKSVSLGAGVESIAENAFAECKSLSEFVTSPALKEIGNNAFHNCFSLKQFEFPKTLTSIGNSAFYQNALERVLLPEGVLTVGESAFARCNALKEIGLPTTLQSIGKMAFNTANQELATTVKSYSENPFEIPNDALCYAGNCTLMVPKTSVEAYKATVPWNILFKDIVALPDRLRGDVNGDSVVNETDVQSVINIILANQYDENADVNLDGTVNMPDAMFIVNKILNGKFPDE